MSDMSRYPDDEELIAYMQGKRVTREQLWALMADGVEAIGKAYGDDPAMIYQLSPGLGNWVTRCAQLTLREQHALAVRQGTPARLRALEALEELREALAAVKVAAPDRDHDAAEIFHSTLDFVLRSVEVFVA